MYNYDSKFLILTLTAACLTLSSCVSEGPDIDVGAISSSLSSMNNSTEQSASGIIDTFENACLSGGSIPSHWAKIAEGNRWQESDTTSLTAAELNNLRKSVLSIPGGGGRFDEVQQIFSIVPEDGIIILNLERRHINDTTLSSRCEVYGKFHYLKTCEALGEAIGRPPDHNQIYEARKAHFIRWVARVGEFPATISCETAPQSATLAYDGISLRLQIDHTEQKKLLASQPTSVVPDR